ncbi:hypothetical protein [Xanthomonas fragariae]|uniref:hypothetical protein n=1 Tax=Xanthomonas fragariae TaxID=48664 RepID=UPI0031B6CDE1
MTAPARPDPMPMRPAARIQIVRRESGGGRSSRRWVWVGVIAILWLASLGGAWWMATRTAAPRLVEAESALQQAQRRQARQRRYA